MNEHPTSQPERRKRGLMTGALVGLVLAGGGVGIAAAAQGAPSTTVPAGQHQEAGDKADATYTSSITAPKTAEGKDGNDASEAASDTAETDALAKLATVTPTQASDAATAAVPGTAATPELSNEDGNVVYDVTVTSADAKTTTDVVVDAGNGKVLVQEVDNEHDGNEAHGNNEQPDVEAPKAPAPATAPGGAPGN